MATAYSLRISPETLSASGRSSEKLSLPALQSKMKIDPEGYKTELGLLYGQFNSSLDLFQQQAALNFTSSSGISSDPSISKELGDRAMFLAHVTPFYPKQLANFPCQLAAFLKSSAPSLPSGLRCHVAQALILLINRKMVEISDTLALFMELQTLGDKNLRKLAFAHVVHSVRRMNKEHRNEAKNRVLQNILFVMLQQEDEAKAKRALVTLCELHRRRVWFDDRTANAICMACFHSSSKIMIAALSFVLDYEKIEGDNDDDGDSDASSDEDDLKTVNPQVAIGKNTIFKATHTGTTASKKKKKAKLQRAIRSMKRRQRISSQKSSSNHYSPLDHLKDAQGFAEKLFSRLQTCNERFEVKMMMVKAVSRTIGLHRLILLNFYPFLQKYVQPHQRDITELLAAAIQACHDMVPPDAVEPLFKQIVNQFVHDRSRPEAIAVGLNVIREICLRMPLLMTEDLLQDLVLYRKTHEKAVSIAARSLMVLFREICPSLLVKKDRGRPSDPKARPRAFGEASVVSDVPGVELLQEESDGDDEIEDTDNDQVQIITYNDGETQDDSVDKDDSDLDNDDDDDDSNEEDNDEEVEDDEDEDNCEMKEEDEHSEDSDSYESDDSDAPISVNEEVKKSGDKRRFDNFDMETANTSLRALKRLAGEKSKSGPSNSTDGILSNEDFKRIKERKANKDANIALAQQGFKLPSTDQLSSKRVDPLKLEAHVRRKLSKEEKLALVKAGREDRGKYQSRAAMKQKKTGGKSNQEKERKKKMPKAALHAKIARSRQEKRKKQSRMGKQFRGKKAWQ